MLMQDQVTGQIHDVPDVGFYAEDLVSGYGEPDLGYMAEDPYGYFGEPEVGYYGEEPVGHYGEEPVGIIYDGFGNPLGFSFRKLWRGVRRIAKRALPIAQHFVPPHIRGLIPIARSAFRALPGAVRQFVPQAAPYVQAAASVLSPGAATPGAAPPPEEVGPPPGVPAAEGPVEGWGWGEAPPAQVGPYRPLPPGWIPRPKPYTGQRPRPYYMRCLVWRGPRGMVPKWAATAQPGAPAPVPPGAAPVMVAPVPVPVPGFTRPVPPRPMPPRYVPPRRPAYYSPGPRGAPYGPRRP